MRRRHGTLVLRSLMVRVHYMLMNVMMLQGSIENQDDREIGWYYGRFRAHAEDLLDDERLGLGQRAAVTSIIQDAVAGTSTFFKHHRANKVIRDLESGMPPA